MLVNLVEMERVILHHVGLATVTSCLPSCPVSQSSDIQKSAAANLSVDKIHRQEIFRPVLLEKSCIIAVEHVIVCANHGPHMICV